MNNDIKQMLLEIGALVFIGVLIIIVIHSFFKEMKKRKRDYENLDKPIKKAPTEFVRATVVNKYTDIVHYGGPKNPKHKIGYFVTFETEDGKQITLDVGEENFGRIMAFTTADLVISEEKFIDFK